MIPESEIKKTLSENFSGVIWKIEIDENLQQIAIETRNVSLRTVAYSVYNYKTGECLIKEKSFEEGWMWGLDRIYNNAFFLYGYITPSSPEHKGIIAVDCITGEIKWQVFHLTLHDISTEGVVVYNPLLQPKRLHLLSFEQGEAKGNIADNYPAPSRNISFPEPLTDTERFPEFMPEAFTGILFHAAVADKECWAFHTRNENGLSQHLFITHHSKIILEEILSSEIQKLNPEAFFVVGNFIFAVRGSNNELVSYLL